MKNLKTYLNAKAGFVVLAGAVLLSAHVTGHSQKAAATPTPIPPPMNVKVVNTEAEPVPVRGVEGPAQQPVHAAGECNFTQSEGSCSANVYTVDAGKRLVIEYASMDGSVPPGDLVTLGITTTVGGVSVEHVLPLSSPSVALVVGAGAGLASVGQQVRLYADAGTVVTVRGQRARAGSISNGQFNFKISGHLVDVP